MVNNNSNHEFFSNNSEPFIIEEQTVNPLVPKINIPKTPFSYRVHYVIAMIFIIVLLLEIFYPVDPYSGGIPFTNGLQLTDILGIPLIILGFIAGISFIIRIYKLTKTGPKVLRIFAFLASIGGGIFLVLVSIIGSIIGQLRGHPISC